MPLAPSFRLGPYEVVELLSAGSMGEVYRARDTRLGRQVAVKILPDAFAGDEERLFRFEQEARAVSRLNHPNIVMVFDIGRHDGISFVVSELVGGTTLRERMQEGPVPSVLAVGIAAQIASGLAAAHAGGVVHRDLKPENVMVTTDDRVKIVDFGIAKVEAPLGGGGVMPTGNYTLPGSLVGTVAYMSPEQVRGEAVDHRTDIFSLGVILYEMLSGRHPFGVTNAVETMTAILRDQPAPLHLDDEALESIVGRALEKAREARFQSAGEMVQSLESSARSGTRTPALAPAHAGPSPGPGAIAVLPFANVSAEADSEYFSDGLTEELVQALTRVPGVRVVAWQSAVQFKGREQDARAIGRELNVGTVLTGSVRKAGDRVRIAARLVEVSTGSYLWSETYDRQIEDVFAIQEEIATAIASTLTPRLVEQPAAASTGRRSPSLEAYNLYLRGRFLWNKRTTEGLLRSVELFEQATALDDRFALAHAGLADAYCLLADYAVEPPAEVMPRARAAAVRALELDPRSAEAHTSFGFIRSQYDWEWLEAEALYRRAIELGPGYATAHHWLALDLLAMLGRFDEAEPEVDLAAHLDPLSLVIQEGRAYLRTLARRYDEAIDIYESLIELDASFYKIYTSLGRALSFAGRFDQALAVMEKGHAMAGDVPPLLGALGQTYAAAGRRDQAERLLEQLTGMAATRHTPATAFALIHAGLGNVSQALDWLERGAARRELSLAALGVHPAYDGLRHEPRFAALLRRMRLPGRSPRGEPGLASSSLEP